MPQSSGTRGRIMTLSLGAAALFAVLSIVVNPDQAFRASLAGLRLWWEIVFPALLPFLVLIELLSGYGALHAMGALFDPLMRRWLRVPGVGAWAVWLGAAAGQPSAAGLIADLRRNGQVTREEAERLLSAAHLANPVVIVSVVGTGFFFTAPGSASCWR